MFTLTGLTASNVTTSSADISWTAGGTETSWNFDYGPTGYTQGQGTSTIAAQSKLFIFKVVVIMLLGYMYIQWLQLPMELLFQDLCKLTV